MIWRMFDGYIRAARMSVRAAEHFFALLSACRKSWKFWDGVVRILNVAYG